MHSLWEVAPAVLLINMPFGFWRAGVRKFSLAWFLAVHLPVLIAIALRLLLKLGWSPATFAALIGSFILGQYVGGKLCKQWKRRSSAR